MLQAEHRNVGRWLSETAARMPDAMAVAEPAGTNRDGKRQYREVSFAQLDRDSHQIAAALARMGVRPGQRLVLMVKPGIDFISLVFALLKSGAVAVLIDPGMGRRNLIRCLQEVQPDGFIAIPLAQAVRTLLRRRFPRSRWHVTVGRPWFWSGPTLDELRGQEAGDYEPYPAAGDDPAAIIFTTGSTGPPKGVLYVHENFNAQVRQIRDVYQIQPGGIDLPGFPLFGLFNAAMGVSTVIPDMDATRPADVDPRKILQAVRDWNVTQSFGSPAMWNTVGRYCQQHGERLESLRTIFTAGAPVPPHVLQRIRAAIHPEGTVHTPYGATESLPVATIESREVLEQTSARSRQGAGTCVGRPFPEIEWRIIRITDEPIEDVADAKPLPDGEIGELSVRGSVVTRCYVTRTEANRLHKVRDGAGFWHRMGDLGYLDEQQRLWFCGRKTHRVQTAEGTLYTIPCEAVFNEHAWVYRSALVGIGSPPHQTPVVIAEPWPEHWPLARRRPQQLVDELRQLAAGHDHTRQIEHFFVRRALPVDIRHNAKIFREQLAEWAGRKMKATP